MCPIDRMHKSRLSSRDLRIPCKSRSVSLVSEAAIKAWKGGKLQLLVPLGVGLIRQAATENGQVVFRDYKPIGNGWAIRTDLDLVARLSNGIELQFDFRGPSLECVEVRSPAEGPAITSSLLRQIEPLIAVLRRDLFEKSVVRLVEQDGTIAAEMPLARLGPERHFVNFGDLDPAVSGEFKRRRRPLTDEKLRHVAELYQEAERLRVPRTEHIAKAYPNYEHTAIRNWIRLARDRGFLEPYQPKGENDGKTT